MRTILDEIVAKKKIEVAERKEQLPVAMLEKLPLFSSPAYSLKRFLIDDEKSGIIAEFKRKSPSKGFINEKASITQITETYANNGASALSVLTDNYFFGGSTDDLISARINAIPILRKDFIIDEYQVIESKAIGADAVLLIAAVLTPAQVKELTMSAHSLGLEVILEVHNENETDHLYEKVDVIGVNNRDLDTFEVSLETSERLAHLLPKEKILVSESGIRSVDDILHLKNFGYDGFLIGEEFMRQSDPGLAFMQFAAALKQATL